MAERKTAAIIGAGISGLCSAYMLKKKGYSVQVFESSGRIGGSIVTEESNGFLMDMGPNSSLETSETLKSLIRELGIEENKVYGSEISNKRYVVRDGKLHTVPTAPGKFIATKLFSVKAKLRLLREPFISPGGGEDISLADFVRRRLGKEFLDYAINPFVAGVYAGDPENLSTAAAFPKLFALEKKYGSLIRGMILGAKERKQRNEVAKDRARLFSFTGGMKMFPEAIAGKLREDIKLDSPVIKILPGEQKQKLWLKGETEPKEYDLLICSVPAFSLAPMLENFEPRAAKSLAEVQYPPVAVVFFGFHKEQIKRPLDGFGFLVPEVEKRRILGSIWSSTIFPNRAPEGYASLTTFVGGSRQPELTEKTDEELQRLVMNELDALMGIEGSPVSVNIKKWPRAIPQYSLGYLKIQKLFDDMENKYPGIYFAGNFRRGISMGDSVLSAAETVEKIEKDKVKI
jgi:oxygen-dependent protoporphyrinogen oxidase